MPLPDHRGIVLFGAGAGGDPGRYSALLRTFAGSGFLVLAPTCERFDPRSVTTEQLQARAESLRAALAGYADPDLPIIAAGHSVGGWAALCLAGAQPWGRDGRPIAVAADRRVRGLVLFAPTVGWFGAPGALANVTAPMVVHIGAADTVTPAATAELLRTAPTGVTVTTHENVGHFDFMSDLPPGLTPTAGRDHDAFLRDLGLQLSDEVDRLTA